MAWPWTVVWWIFLEWRRQVDYRLAQPVPRSTSITLRPVGRQRLVTNIETMTNTAPKHLTKSLKWYVGWCSMLLLDANFDIGGYEHTCVAGDYHEEGRRNHVSWEEGVWACLPFCFENVPIVRRIFFSSHFIFFLFVYDRRRRRYNAGSFGLS